MKVKIGIGIVIIVAILVGAYLYVHHLSQPLVTNVYHDASTGFNLIIPAVWNEVGYSVVKDTDAESGAKVSTFFLHYKNATGATQNFTAVSTIAAVPVSATSTYCKPSPISCAPTQEIGRNNSYVFLSVDTTPEAWGDCVPGSPDYNQAFYNQIKTICSIGREALSYPERNPNSFTIFEPQN